MPAAAHGCVEHAGDEGLEDTVRSEQSALEEAACAPPDRHTPPGGKAVSVNDEPCEVLFIACKEAEAEDRPDGWAEGFEDASPAGHSVASTATVSVHDVLRENHGTAVCKAGDFGKILLMLLMIGCAVLVVSTQQERLVALAEWIEDLEALGHVIFFLLFIWVGLPCGYNWSTVVILVGFAYGWRGVVDCYVGTVCSAVLSYYGSRYCLRAWMDRRLSALSAKKRLYLQVALSVIGSGRAGLLMQVIMRLQPVQTFGLTNAFFGAMTPDLHVLSYVLSTFLGMQYGIMMMTSVGILVRDVGSVTEAMSSDGSRWNLLVQGLAAVTMAVAVFFYSRHLAVNVLPRHIPEDAVIEVSEDDAREGTAGRAEPDDVPPSPPAEELGFEQGTSHLVIEVSEVGVRAEHAEPGDTRPSPPSEELGSARGTSHS